MESRRPVAGARLLKARTGKGWTLRDMAQRCRELGHPIDHGTIARYENGQSRPNPGNLAIIARALEVKPDSLLLEDEPDGSAA